MAYFHSVKREVRAYLKRHIIDALNQCARKRFMVTIYFGVMCLAILANMFITKRPIGLGNFVFYFGLFSAVSTRGLLLEVAGHQVANACALSIAMFLTMIAFCLTILF